METVTPGNLLDDDCHERESLSFEEIQDKEGIYQSVDKDLDHIFIVVLNEYDATDGVCSSCFLWDRDASEIGPVIISDWEDEQFYPVDGFSVYFKIVPCKRNFEQ